MKKAPVLNAVFLGAGLAIGFLLLAEPSLAADMMNVAATAAFPAA